MRGRNAKRLRRAIRESIAQIAPDLPKVVYLKPEKMRRREISDGVDVNGKPKTRIFEYVDTIRMSPRCVRWQYKQLKRRMQRVA